MGMQHVLSHLTYVFNTSCNTIAVNSSNVTARILPVTLPSPLVAVFNYIKSNISRNNRAILRLVSNIT